MEARCAAEKLWRSLEKWSLDFVVKHIQDEDGENSDATDSPEHALTSQCLDLPEGISGFERKRKCYKIVGSSLK